MLPLINVSPREAYLEARVKELEAENEYLKRLDNAPRYSVLREPEVWMAPNPIGSSISLPVAASASLEDHDNTLHVLVRERGFALENFHIHYCISKMELLTARDRAGILQFLHERTLREVGAAFFGFSRS